MNLKLMIELKNLMPQVAKTETSTAVSSSVACAYVSTMRTASHVIKGEQKKNQ